MRFALLLAPAILAAAPANAVVRPFVVGVTAGSLGVGPEVTYTVDPIVSLRGSATFFGLNGSRGNDDFRYRGRIRANNFGGTVDVHPFLNGFRLSAGVRSTANNRIRFTGRATRNMSYSGQVFTPDQIGTINGVIKTNKVSPLVSLGYAHTNLVGITFGVDAGVMFHGNPRARNFSATGELGTNPNAANEYANQRERVQNFVDGFRYYPILQLSLGYRF